MVVHLVDDEVDEVQLDEWYIYQLYLQLMPEQ